MNATQANGRMKWLIVSIGVVLVIAVAGIFCFIGSGKVSAMPVAVEDIQYPFEKGGGLINVAIEDVFMGVGMLTGERKKDEVRTSLTGSVNFELASKKTQARLQVDRVRLIERTTTGEDGRVFEPGQIRDTDMEKGLESDIQFPEEKGKFPFVWENGKSDCVYFTFNDIPVDVGQADLVIIYQGKFPGKKHAAYYEDRFPVKRKTYLRNR